MSKSNAILSHTITGKIDGWPEGRACFEFEAIFKSYLLKNGTWKKSKMGTTQAFFECMFWYYC